MAALRWWTRPIAVALAVALAAGGGGAGLGCSITLSGPSRSAPPEQFPKCDDDTTLPAIDLAGAALFLLGGLLFVTADEPLDEGLDDDDVTVAVTTGLLGAVLGGVGIFGLSTVRSCTAARSEYRERYQLQQQQRQQQQPLPPPAGPPPPFGPPSAVPPAPKLSPPPAEPPPPPEKPPSTAPHRPYP